MAYKKPSTFGLPGAVGGTFAPPRPPMPPTGPATGGAGTYGFVPPEPPPGGGGGGNSGGQGSVPPGSTNCGPGCFEFPQNSGNCICPPGGGGGAPPNQGGGQQGQCPPGEVWRNDAAGHHGTGQPGCEPEDWRSKNGQDTCIGVRPSNCLPQCTWCDFNDAQFKCDENCNNMGGYGGGGSGGGGGGGGHGAPKPPGGGMPFDPGMLQSDIIWKTILARLQGGSRYTPEVMSSLLGGQKMAAEQQATAGLEQSNDDLALRGLARSGIAAGAARGIRNNASNQVLQSKNAILKAKIDADYEDKTQAIKEAMDWLNSLRDYTARMAATQAQKDAAMANIQLGYARLAQEMKMMREQYAQQLQWWTITNGANAGLPF